MGFVIGFALFLVGAVFFAFFTKKRPLRQQAATVFGLFLICAIVGITITVLVPA